MGVFQNNLMGAAAAAASAGGGEFYTYQIANSCRFNGTNSRLTKTWGSAATTDDKKVVSVWVKLSTGDFAYSEASRIWSSAQDDLAGMYFKDGASVNSFAYDTSNGGANPHTNAKFRDPSAWIHIVWIYDSSQSTATDRVKTYINGDYKNLTDTAYWGGTATPNLNTDVGLGKNGNENHIGDYQYNSSGWFNGQMADFICIDGTAAISDFGETKNGVWIPSDPSGLTFGNNGFWLKFESSGDLGNDSSGNNNDWASANLSTHDQMLDSPTFSATDGNSGNFCTANPVYRGTNTTDAQYGVLSEGNLTHTYSGTSNASRPCTHKTPASGKWYFEYRIDAGGGSSGYSPGMGIMDPNVYTFVNGNFGDPGNICYDNATNKVDKDGSFVGVYSGSRGSDGDVMGIAVDMDNGAFYVSKQGTYQTIDGGSQGDPTSGASRTGAGATWTPASEYTSGMVPVSQPVGGSAPIITMNFGQNGTFNGNETAGGNADANGYGNFFTAPPSGFLAVCSGNLTTAAEVDPAQTDDDYPQKLFAPKLYTGDGATTLTISGMDLQPDWTWIKNRDAADSHCLFDSTRGVTKVLHSDTTAAEATDADTLKSWTSDGFTVGADVKVNTSGEDYVSFNWRANGGTTSTNTAGDINSTVQVDPSGHFSIVKYTGESATRTIGHGLSATPNWIIVKSLDATRNWAVYYGDNTDALQLNNTNATDDGIYWADTSPTSTLFSVGDSSETGKSEDYIAYCFANCEGYIKAGTYVGNGNDDGTFVYTGHRPAMMILREYGAADNWLMYNNKTLGYNLDSAGNAQVYPDTSSAEENQASRAIDILSNGFKLRTSNSTGNAGSGNYVYLSMSHNPFQYATAR